jgi:hypothetical protein
MGAGMGSKQGDSEFLILKMKRELESFKVL